MITDEPAVTAERERAELVDQVVARVVRDSREGGVLLHITEGALRAAVAEAIRQAQAVRRIPSIPPSGV